MVAKWWCVLQYSYAIWYSIHELLARCRGAFPAISSHTRTSTALLLVSLLSSWLRRTQSYHQVVYTTSSMASGVGATIVAAVSLLLPILLPLWCRL